MIEFPPGTKLGDLQAQFTREDLIRESNEMIDNLLEMIRDVPDSYVTFEPKDPEADDPFAADESEIRMPWTLGHVIVHVTASCEEAAARGATLARGVKVLGRSRYEVHWTTMKTTAQLVARLEESRRMQMAFLTAWPDEPHLDNLYTEGAEYWGELNAVGMTLGGLAHASSHLGQIKEIIRQAGEGAGA